MKYLGRILIIIVLFFDLAGNAQQVKDYDEAIIIGDELFIEEKIIQAENYYMIALALRSNDSYALGQIKKIEQVKNSQSYREERYLEIIDKADDLFRKYKFDDALTEYTKALTIIPYDGYAQGKVNRILEIKESPNENSQKFNNFMSTGIILLDQNKFADAIKSFRKAAKLLPDNTAPDLYIAETKQARINLEEKLTTYSKEIELANEYIETEEYSKTLVHLKKAKEIFPDNWALATEINNYTLLTKQQHDESQIDEIENKQVVIQLTDSDNNAISERKYTEILPEVIESKSSLLQYNSSLNILSESAPPKNYQPEIDISIEQNQKEIDEISANLKKLKEIDQKYTDEIVTAQNHFNNGQFHEARISFVSASQIKPLEAKPKQFIATIDSILIMQEDQKRIDQQFNSYIVKGDSLLDLNLFNKSIAAFTEALIIKSDDSMASEKLQTTQNKKAEYFRAIQITQDYNFVIKEADSLLAEEKYLLSSYAYEKALSLKPDEAYTKVQIKEIAGILAKIEHEINQKYNNAITIADNLYNSSKLIEALVQYKIAMDIKSSDSYPQNKIAEINTLIEEDLKKLRDKYNVAIANADKLYAVKIYDKAIDAYRAASNTLPIESYPKEMISKIITLMEENAIVEILNDTITISSETAKTFNFEPVNINVRRTSYIFFKAINLSGEPYKLIVSYGSDKGKNGGFVVVVAEGTEKNDYVVRVGNQYKWFADDNNWISIYPEKGDIQLSMMQISKSN